MQSFTVGKNEDGMRLDRLIDRLLPGAEPGFKFKMLRKKNIVLNDRKAEGRERLAEGDEVKLYLSDETWEKLGGTKFRPGTEAGRTEAEAAGAAGRSAAAGSSGPAKTSMRPNPAGGFDLAAHILYEDEDVILVNKPAGILTQKAEGSDLSLNEYLLDYLLGENKISEEELVTFRPSVCNRLDRNTAGIVCCGVSIAGLRELSRLFRERSIHKYYLAAVKGRMTAGARKKAYLVKDEKTNKVEIFDSPRPGAELIDTAWRPLKYDEESGCSLAEIELFTGKSHQIRAQLAHEGFPVAGDSKYGDTMLNRRVRDSYRVRSQLLLAYRVVFPEECSLDKLAGREFKAALPPEFFIRLP